MVTLSNPKLAAAQAALQHVRSGMTLGLGTGSTMTYFVDLLGNALQSGALSDIRGIPTSQATAQQARSLGIPLISLTDVAELDLAIDGADEIDPQGNLIKGLGKALLREKLVEIHARNFLVIADDSKLVQRLGEKCPLPVEIVPFEAAATLRFLAKLADRAEYWLTADGSPATTDNGNQLAKLYWRNGISDPHALASRLTAWPGVVEHGLFLDMAQRAIIASPYSLQEISYRS